MKKHKLLIALILSLLVLAAPLRAAAAGETGDFTLSGDTVFSDMDRSWARGYAPKESWDTLTMVLPVTSDKAAGDIQAELVMADDAVSPFTVQAMTARTQSAGEGLWAARFSLRLYSDRQNGDYPCAVRVTGTDGEGNALTADIPVIVPIRGGQANRETPRLALESPQSDLKLGEEGTIALTLGNPSATLPAEGVTLSFSDETGEVLPTGSDTFFVSALEPGESAELDIPVTVLPGGSVQPHSLLFTLNWTALGTKCTQSEHITIPVVQEIRLEQGGLRMASSAVAGDSLTATLPLMNLGKGDVVNATVTLSLPGIAERQSVLVGTIQPGETREAQLTVAVPTDALGPFTGTITAEATDNSGNPASLSVPVSLTVEAPAPAVSLDSDGETPAKTPAAVWWLSAACVLLTAALVAQGVLLRGKLHKAEEEKL